MSSILGYNKNMSWCFGLVNNRLAEVFFEKKGKTHKFLGHAYVKESEYKTKKEKEWIKNDTSKVILIYRNGIYRAKGTGNN